MFFMSACLKTHNVRWAFGAFSQFQSWKQAVVCVALSAGLKFFVLRRRRDRSSSVGNWVVMFRWCFEDRRAVMNQRQLICNSVPFFQTESSTNFSETRSFRRIITLVSAVSVAWQPAPPRLPWRQRSLWMCDLQVNSPKNSSRPCFAPLGR